MGKHNLHDLIMHQGAKQADPIIIAMGMDAVGQKNHRHRPIQIHPEGRAGESQMADGVWRKEPTGAGPLGAGTIEPQAPPVPEGFFQKLLPFHEHSGGFGRDGQKKLGALTSVKAQKALGPLPYIVHRAEKACMAGHTVQAPGVFVVDFPAHESPPPWASFRCHACPVGLLFLRDGKKGDVLFRVGFEPTVSQMPRFSWKADPLGEQSIKSHPGDVFQDPPQEQIAQVAVEPCRAGFVHKGFLEDPSHENIFSVFRGGR